MPIYEYDCPHCGERFEHLARSAGERRPPACPRCGRHDAVRQMSVIASPRSASTGRSVAGERPPCCHECPGSGGDCPLAT